MKLSLFTLLKKADAVDLYYRPALDKAEFAHYYGNDYPLLAALAYEGVLYYFQDQPVTLKDGKVEAMTFPEPEDDDDEPVEVPLTLKVVRLLNLSDMVTK